MDNNAQNQDDPQAKQPLHQPVVPIGGVNKEVAPLVGNAAEYIKPTEVKPELSKDVVEVGVEHSPEDKLHIPHEAVQIGVSHAKEHVEHHVEPVGVVKLPQITQQQAAVMKNRSMKDAAKWLATFVLRQFDKIAYQKLPIKQ
jgi:hypothetical protein